MSGPALFSKAIALGCIGLVLMGCAKGPSGHGTTAATPTSRAASAVAGSACDRHVVTAEDFAGILKAPITATEPLPGDAQSCQFKTDGFAAITVSIRPGQGRTTVEAWASGKMNLPTSPLTGIGESAVWQETLHEVIAQKNALLCDIQVRAGGDDLAMASNALPAALGALCNRIFAAS